MADDSKPAFSKLPPPEELASDLMPDVPEEEFASDLMPDIPDEPEQVSPSMAAPAPVTSSIPTTPVNVPPGQPIVAFDMEMHRAVMDELEAARALHEEERKRYEASAEQLQSIISTVLEAAEVANKAGVVAAASHKAMNAASTNLTVTAKKSAKGGQILVIAGGVGMVLAASAFVAMAIQLQHRVSQADALLVKIGTQAIEIRESMQAVANVSQGINNLAQRDGQLVESQASMTTKIEALAKTLKMMEEEALKKEAAMKKVFDEALAQAKKPDPSLAKLLTDIKGLETQIKQQSSALNETSKRIGGVNKEIADLKRVGSNVETLKAQVEAMVVLERQRYREALEKANKKVDAETAVAFPRREPIAPVNPGAPR